MSTIKKFSYIRPLAWQAIHAPLQEPAKEVKSICCLCNGGCGLVVSLDSQGQIQGVYGDQSNPFNQGRICPKPITSAQSIYHPQRVRTPLIRVNGKLTPATWDDALELIASRYLNYVAQQDNSAVIGISSKIGASYSKLAFSIFQDLTGLVAYDTAPICYASEAAARTSLLGGPSTPNPLADVIHAKILLIVGNNIAQTKAGQYQWIVKARQQGTKVVVVDTRYTETAQQADLFLRIKPGTDAALALALIREVVANNLHDAEFVAQNTVGFSGLVEAAEPYTPERTQEITGIPAEVIRQLANDLGHLKPGMFYGGRGIMCTNNAAGAVLGFEALMCILGNLGKPGGGIISHISGYGKAQVVPKEKVVKPAKSRKVAEIYPAMESGEIKMIIIAGNPVVTWPDSRRMAKALAGLDFVVSHTLFLDDTASLAHVVLPATHWLEEAGAQPSVHRVMQWREKAVEPYGESKSGGDFYRLLAGKMGLPTEYFPTSPEEAWEVERKHNPAISGISLSLLRESPGGVSYPYPEGGTPSARLYTGGKAKTPSGKVQLESTTLSERYPYYQDPLNGPGNDEAYVADYPLMLNTAKVAPCYHSQSQYSSWVKEVISPYLEIHPDLARQIGVQDGDLVIVETRRASITLPAKLTRSVAKDSVCTQYHFGLVSPFKQEPANSLFPVAVDPVGGNFVQKNLQCRVRKAEEGISRDNACHVG